MFVQLETLTTLGKGTYRVQMRIRHMVLLKTTKTSFRACKYILTPCINKTLLNVVFDQSISGIFWAGSKTTKQSFIACKYILSPCNQTLLNVVFDQSISGIFWAGSKTTKQSFIACKYILSPCNQTLLNVVFDQSISGMFWAVKSADINS